MSVKDTECVAKVSTAVSQHKQIREKKQMIVSLQSAGVNLVKVVCSFSLNVDDNIVVLHI